MLIFDIETDGLLDTMQKIYCISVYDTISQKHYMFDPRSRPITEGVNLLQEGDAICGHNIIGFDIPAIKKIYPEFKPKKVLDTLVWVRLEFPDIKSADFGYHQKGLISGKLIGSHSLEAWGYRLGVYKGEFCHATDWQNWSLAMSEYCKQDVEVTRKLYEMLGSRKTNPEALELEISVAQIISQQERYGVYFNKARAEEFYIDLIGKRNPIQDRILKEFPPFYKSKKVFTPKRDNSKKGYVANAPMTQVELVEFNPASNQHIYMMLQKKYGWEATEFTKKTNEPVINDEILKALSYPEAELLAEYLLLNKRIAQLAEGNQAWLKFYNEKTHRIHGVINSCGAVTGRMTHFNPNLAQVPASYSPYGSECRSLFCVPKGHILVGGDASGLEARCLAHFMAPYDRGEYIKIILEGKKEDGTDTHSLNAKALGCSRDDAKTWFYAFIYGAGNSKLGGILKGNERTGITAKKRFFKKFPALRCLIGAVQTKAKKQGWIYGLDGRRLQIRKIHSALNTLLQSAGALIMKKALVLCNSELEKQFQYGVDFGFVLNVHDEFQIEVSNFDNAETIGKIIRESIIKAGEHFNFRCPLDAEYSIGSTWAETH